MSIDKYKYTGVDLSPIALYILHPFWNFVVECVPVYVTANLLTVLGGLAFFVGYLVTIYYNPNFAPHSLPPWVCIFCGLCVFLYQTLDGIDGKQARRTKQQSPLGEMLDHGVDALFSVFGQMAIATAAQLGNGWWTFSLCFLITVIPFYIVQWESYHTHVLVLWYVNGPTEGLLFLVGVYFALGISGETGARFFNTPVRELGLKLPEVFGTELRCSHFLVLVTAAASIVQVLASVVAVIRKLRVAKQPFLPAFMLLVPAILLGVAGTLYVKYNFALYQQNPHTVLLLLGFAVSNLTIRIIAGHRMGERPKLLHAPSLIVLLVAANTVVPALLQQYAGFAVKPMFELPVLQVGCAVVVAYHLAYMGLLIREFMDHFQIGFLRIKKTATA